ncbi:MAG: PEGA domain-containing protein [Methanoregula sp.]|nr:PEGA domain-containing protein [Methanoregula sp.]
MLKVKIFGEKMSKPAIIFMGILIVFGIFFLCVLVLDKNTDRHDQNSVSEISNNSETQKKPVQNISELKKLRGACYSDCSNASTGDYNVCIASCDDRFYPEEERIIVQKTLSACYDNCTYEWSELRCVRLYNVTRQNLSTVNATVAAQYEQCAHMLSGTVGDCMAICGQQYYVPQTPVPVRTPIQTTQLNIVTDPSGSAVKIDGIYQQVKTPASLPIKAGTHTVTLVLDGYRNYSIIFDSSPFETWNITHAFELTSSAQR